jgi:hypothetical protein
LHQVFKERARDRMIHHSAAGGESQ